MLQGVHVSVVCFDKGGEQGELVQGLCDHDPERGAAGRASGLALEAAEQVLLFYGHGLCRGGGRGQGSFGHF